MGIYLNPSNEMFQKAVRSKIYVDKTGLISYTNSVLRTTQEYICVSRPRRFGKTMAANMLSAYYSRGNDSRALFDNFIIAGDESYETHLNRYNVIFLNMQSFLSVTGSIEAMINRIRNKVLKEIKKAFPDVIFDDTDYFADSLENAYEAGISPFVFIIDEWDCIFREFRENKEAQAVYLDFLRNLLKDRVYVALAYMTGILPIKKYGSHSALNMFDEFSMSNAGELAEYVGFTQNEVMSLCERFRMDYDEMSRWYNGYRFKGIPAVYSPRSVVSALLRGVYDDYWNKTESYEALKIYIEMNLDGLKDIIIQLLAGGRKEINIGGFQNDMVTFQTYDDVLALLIHLGYLAYDFDAKEVFIPNKEIADEFVTSVKDARWVEVVKALNSSNELLEATWNGDEKAVAEIVESVHNETAILTYNNETALSYTVSLAYFNAREYYTIVREMPSGKGFADLIFLPRKNHPDKPALIVELKWDLSAETAIRQIKDKNYPDALKDCGSRILLVGISYNRETKEHECMIEQHQACFN